VIRPSANAPLRPNWNWCRKGRRLFRFVRDSFSARLGSKSSSASARLVRHCADIRNYAKTIALLRAVSKASGLAIVLNVCANRTHSSGFPSGRANLTLDFALGPSKSRLLRIGTIVRFRLYSPATTLVYFSSDLVPTSERRAHHVAPHRRRSVDSTNPGRALYAGRLGSHPLERSPAAPCFGARRRMTATSRTLCAARLTQPYTSVFGIGPAAESFVFLKVAP
jgi:hypothetical protein